MMGLFECFPEFSQLLRLQLPEQQQFRQNVTK